MWCNNCKIETLEETCPICGQQTDTDIPVEVYWCGHCMTPIMYKVNMADKAKCPLCQSKIKYLCADLRPVFPEERLLVELLLGKEPNSLKDKSVWASNNRYYIDGKSKAVTAAVYKKQDPGRLREALEKHSQSNDEKTFNKLIDTFIQANSGHLAEIIEEAHEFIREEAGKYPQENIVLSFSGGKDSTVTADIVTKALSNASLVHIFGNTTLEFPLTLEYAQRFRQNHPQAIFQVAENKEQNFMDMCEEIGPPARLMRWCCSMFKTGPITRIINNLYRNQQILTFYGIRRYESVSRSKYNRVEKNSESVKIQQQTVAAPIFNWKDLEVWLYLLSEQVDFNDAYRLGYDRVGCWCCPNNNGRAQFLSEIYMPEQTKKWREFLLGFARKIGKPDPEVYVDTGKWKARQGGNGLSAAQSVKLQFTNCTAEENSKIYKLFHPYSDELINMFVPFGKIAPELGQKLLNETIVLDHATNVPILSIQPFTQDGYDYAVKVKTMNVKDHEAIQRMASYQIRKFNACRRCLKCESLCRSGAISIVGDSYYIDSDKCVHVHFNDEYVQTYDIISTVISKDKTKWNSFRKKYAEELDTLVNNYKIHAMFNDVPQEARIDTLLGAYPLHPSSLFVLPRLSERVAQNERTLFTFLSADSHNTMSEFIKEHGQETFSLITPDYIFDYFQPLMEKEVHTGTIYKNYELAKNILVKLEDNSLEGKIIKILAVIYMLEQYDILCPVREELEKILEPYYSHKEVTKAVDELIDKEYVIYLKRSNGFLCLKQSSGVNIYAKIADMKAAKANTDIKEILNTLNFDRYVYPARYNDEKEMTRFFVVEFIYASEITDAVNWEIKGENIKADGVIYAVLVDSEDELESVRTIVASTTATADRCIFACLIIVWRFGIKLLNFMRLMVCGRKLLVIRFCIANTI